MSPAALSKTPEHRERRLRAGVPRARPEEGAALLHRHPQFIVRVPLVSKTTKTDPMP